MKHLLLLSLLLLSILSFGQTAEDLSKSGYKKYKEKNYKGAIKDYTSALAIKKVDSIYKNRGNAKLEVGDTIGAKEDFKKSIAINPKYAPGYLSLGYLRFNLKDYEGAIEYYNQCIQIDSLNFKAYASRGSMKGYLNDYTGSEKDLTTAIEINSKDTTSYFNRGQTYMRLKQYKKAYNDFDKLIQLSPPNAEYYVLRANAGQYIDARKAIADATKAIDMEPKNVRFYIVRGNIELKINEKYDALWDLSKVIELDSSHASAHEQRGILYLYQGKDAEATEDFLQAISLDTNSYVAYFGMGVLAVWERDYEAALSQFDIAIERSDEYGECYYMRGYVNSMLDNKSEADADFKMAEELGYKANSDTEIFKNKPYNGYSEPSEEDKERIEKADETMGASLIFSILIFITAGIILSLFIEKNRGIRIFLFCLLFVFVILTASLGFWINSRG